MNSHCALGTRRSWRRQRLIVAGTSLVVCLAWAHFAAAESGTQVVRVEEDWELVVGTPDGDTVAPQVTCAFSPVGNLDSVYATLELNHQSQPVFVPGGLQLQVWDDDAPLSSRKFPNDHVMTAAGETVRWTQVMKLDGGVLTFEIVNGASTTWGNFGGQGYLRASLTTDLQNLNGYSPSVSVHNSGAGYAANRVQSLVLKRVRVVTSTGDTWESSDAQPVAQ